MESKLGLIRTLVRQRADPFQILTMLRLRRELSDCRSVLDVGCGNASPLRWLKLGDLTGVEGYAPSFQEANKNKTHHRLIQGDVRELNQLVGSSRFDACIALDVIEHLDKRDGLALASN